MPAQPSDPRPEKRRRVSSSAEATGGGEGEPAAVAPSPPAVRPRDVALRVSLQSPPSVPVPSRAEDPSSDPTRRSPVDQEEFVAAASRTGSGQTPRVSDAHSSRATRANTAIGSPRPVADSIPRASLSGLSGPATAEGDEVLPTAAPQQILGRRRGAHSARTPTPTPPELTRADSESDSGESMSDLAAAVQLRGRDGSGRPHPHLVRTPAAPPSPSVQATTPGASLFLLLSLSLSSSLFPPPPPALSCARCDCVCDQAAIPSLPWTTYPPCAPHLRRGQCARLSSLHHLQMLAFMFTLGGIRWQVRRASPARLSGMHLAWAPCGIGCATSLCSVNGCVHQHFVYP